MPIGRNAGRGAAALALAVLASRVLAQQDPAEEARLKKLEAGPKTIDVSKYPREQQQAYKLFQARCSTCHAAAWSVNTETVLPGDWERLFKRMMLMPNSGISKAEGRTLYRFMVYDASVRKAEALRQAVAALPAPERPVALEEIKAVNVAFGVP